MANTWRRAYYASVSYVDSNIGKLLDALDALGFTDDTVVSLSADHGMQIGEQGMWQKSTLWEISARSPWILAAPHKPQNHGKVTTALTENVDLYATLASIAGLPPPAIGGGGGVEGDDLHTFPRSASSSAGSSRQEQQDAAGGTL